MAVDLPTLVGQWQVEESSFILDGSTSPQILAADPMRLAFGIATDKVTQTIRFKPLPIQSDGEGILMVEKEEKWFYWGKHASFVSQAFFASLVNGGPSKITVWVVRMTNRK